VNPRRLYRSDDDRILAGVAGGVAAYFDVDPAIVRIIWFFSVFLTGSLTFWAYLVMIIVVPLEPAEWPPQSPWAPGGAPAASPSPAGYAPTATGGPPVEGPGGSTGSAESGTNAPSPDPNATPPGTPSLPASDGWWSSDWRMQRRQERWQRRADRRPYERGGFGLAFGLLLILVGGMLVWHQIDPRFDLNLTWPVAIVALGAILVVSSIRSHGRG
jgi:phage shock protein C